jgi:hypothetical protein
VTKENRQNYRIGYAVGRFWAHRFLYRKQECYSLDQHVCCKVCHSWRSFCIVTQCSSLTGARNRVHSRSPLMWLYSWRCRHYVHPKSLYPPTRVQHGTILGNNNSIYCSRIRKWILSVLLSVGLSVTLWTCVTSDTVQRIFIKFWYWNVSSKLNKQSSAHLQVSGPICINSLVEVKNFMVQ